MKQSPAINTITPLVNGRPMELPTGLTLDQLLQKLNLQPEHIAVAINEKVIASEHFAEYRLGREDTVEIVQFVGGG